jgi:hypothetical protein
LNPGFEFINLILQLYQLGDLQLPPVGTRSRIANGVCYCQEELGISGKMNFGRRLRIQSNMIFRQEECRA